MRACDPLVVSKRKRARDISRSRFVSIFETRAACTAEESRKEGGKRRAINRRARNARNAAGHGARDRDRSCQMPSNRFVSCHPVRLWWITFVVPRARKCAIFPSLLFSIRSRFVLECRPSQRRQRHCHLRVVRMPLVAFETRERTRRRRACASSINPSFDR